MFHCSERRLLKISLGHVHKTFFTTRRSGRKKREPDQAKQKAPIPKIEKTLNQIRSHFVHVENFSLKHILKVFGYLWLSAFSLLLERDREAAVHRQVT